MAGQIGPSGGSRAREVRWAAVAIGLLAVGLVPVAAIGGWLRPAVVVLAVCWAAVAIGLLAALPSVHGQDRLLRRDLRSAYPLDPLDVDEPRPWGVATVAGAVAFRLEDTPYRVRFDHQVIVVEGGPTRYELGTGSLERSFRLTLAAGRHGEFEQTCHDDARVERRGKYTRSVHRDGRPPEQPIGHREIGDLMTTRHLTRPLHHAMAESGWQVIPRRSYILDPGQLIVGAAIVVAVLVPTVLGRGG